MRIARAVNLPLSALDYGVAVTVTTASSVGFVVHAVVIRYVGCHGIRVVDVRSSSLSTIRPTNSHV